MKCWTFLLLTIVFLVTIPSTVSAIPLFCMDSAGIHSVNPLTGTSVMLTGLNELDTDGFGGGDIAFGNGTLFVMDAAGIHSLNPLTGENSLLTGLNILDTDNVGGGSLAYMLINTNSIPEPTTILLFGVGLLGIAGMGRRKNNPALVA
jgi:hypothetical protein